MNMGLKPQIEDNRIYAPLKQKWMLLKAEEKVRQEYICRLINDYGFTLEQMAQELKVNNSQRGLGRARADIVVWRNIEDKMNENCPIIVVECKAEHITIREEDYFQGYNYASWAGADFFVTTNLKETRIFRVLKGKIPKRLDEIIDIPKAEIVNNNKEIDKLLTQTKSFTREEFSKLLFKCHNIIRNNDKLSPEAAFDEISKILFIKIRYERENKEGQIFSRERFVDNKLNYERLNSEMGITNARQFYQELFEKTKRRYLNEDLFDPNETLKIRENSFEAIVEELQIYNLSTTSDDVKGIAFERFLGRTFRGELGQFFTPRTVVDFMTKILDPKEGEIVCDPCCGSGGFLIRSFEYIRSQIENDLQQKKEKLKELYFNDQYSVLPDDEKEKVEEEVNTYFNLLNTELDSSNPKSRLYRLSYNCIFGTDANPRMSRTAKMNMIMHGDGHGGVHHNDGLLNVNGIFDNRFDIILTNPPFGARIEKSLMITEADKYKDKERIEKYRALYGKEYDKALKQISDNIGKPLLNLYATGSMSTLTEVLFMERCLNLLKPGGRMGIVLPEGVLNNSNLQRVREFMEGKAKIILITSIPQDVFIASGATVKPSIMFFKKFTKQETQKWKSIKTKAINEINKKYEDEKNPIVEKLKNKNLTKEEKKVLKEKLKIIEDKINEEIKTKIKENFDYQIPISKVEKAGISTTGGVIENELIPLEKEYTTYRKKNNLWSSFSLSFEYDFVNGEIIRKNIDSDNEAFTKLDLL